MEKKEVFRQVLDELRAYHDREWVRDREGLPSHMAAAFPEECGGCAAIEAAERSLGESNVGLRGKWNEFRELLKAAAEVLRGALGQIEDLPHREPGVAIVHAAMSQHYETVSALLRTTTGVSDEIDRISRPKTYTIPPPPGMTSEQYQAEAAKLGRKEVNFDDLTK
jgi:hypothetical protein